MDLVNYEYLNLIQGFSTNGSMSGLILHYKCHIDFGNVHLLSIMLDPIKFRSSSITLWPLVTYEYGIKIEHIVVHCISFSIANLKRP